MSDKDLQQEAILDFAARRKKALTLRKYRNRIDMAKKRLSRRMADSKHLMKRARHMAVKILRRKFAGKLGLEYSTLSVSQKMMIDAKVQQRKGLIGKIAARLLPRVRAKELARLKSLRNKSRSDVGPALAANMREDVGYQFDPDTLAKLQNNVNQFQMKWSKQAPLFDAETAQMISWIRGLQTGDNGRMLVGYGNASSIVRQQFTQGLTNQELYSIGLPTEELE